MKGGLATGGAADTATSTALGAMLAVTAVLAGGAILLTRAATAFGSMRRGAGERRSSKEGEGE